MGMRLRQNRGYGAGFSSFYPAMGTPASGAAPGMYPAMGAAPAAPAMYPAMGGTASSPKFQKSLDDERRADALKAMAFSQSRAGGADMATADKAGYAAGKGAVAGLAPDYLARQTDAADANKRANAESGANVGMTSARANDIRAYGDQMYPAMAAETTARAKQTEALTPAEVAIGNARAGQITQQTAQATAEGPARVAGLEGANAKTAAEAMNIIQGGGAEAIKRHKEVLKERDDLQTKYQQLLMEQGRNYRNPLTSPVLNGSPPATQPTASR